MGDLEEIRKHRKIDEELSPPQTLGKKIAGVFIRGA
jgi:hypothetical protein